MIGLGETARSSEMRGFALRTIGEHRLDGLTRDHVLVTTAGLIRTHFTGRDFTLLGQLHHGVNLDLGRRTGTMRVE